ncbi:MAG TPA: class I SAM-dependent methyltransferase, partial [Parvularculaceae bacterium]|nr:class I SAM-dependent methyltransferase [Parvularculaceae bacterium]
MTSSYHATRFTEEEKRDVLWRTLWRSYFKTRVPEDGCVLDLGSGYGQFINNVEARRRIAIDAWAGFPNHLADGVEAIVGDVADLRMIDDGVVDFAFASNIFEHLPQERVAKALSEVRRVLSGRGTLTILQPNFAYAYREYFDDYTHVSIWSHVSMANFLEANGFDDAKPQMHDL